MVAAGGPSSLLLHLPSPLAPRYGYAASASRPPRFTTYAIAFAGKPPSHPESHAVPESGSHVWSQSTSCCSDKETSAPDLTKWAPSTAPVAEKLQHDPHIPWFFTGVTAPSALQSKFRGMFSVGRCGRTRDDSCRLRRSTRAASIGSRMRSDDANSSSVRSANGVAPYSAPSRADISFARAMFSANISRRFAYSFASEAYVFPCSSTNASKSRSCRVIRRRDARGDVDARSSRPTEKDDRRAPRAGAHAARRRTTTSATLARRRERRVMTPCTAEARRRVMKADEAPRDGLPTDDDVGLGRRDENHDAPDASSFPTRHFSTRARHDALARVDRSPRARCPARHRVAPTTGRARRRPRRARGQKKQNDGERRRRDGVVVGERAVPSERSEAGGERERVLQRHPVPDPAAVREQAKGEDARAR
eukprot:29120-Pelagococcus_subviridis.AAC.6